jgi:ribosomal protein S18 acetylase RimI-like enzyme
MHKLIMEIRIFKENDRKAVVELWEACGFACPWNDPYKDIDRKIRFQQDLFFVGAINSNVVSSAMAGYDGHRGSIFYLAVHPKMQELGYGKKTNEAHRNCAYKYRLPKIKYSCSQHK